jgi:hypothetical protein
MGSPSAFRVAFHQTSGLGQHDGTDGFPSGGADGRAEGNPRAYIAQRGHEHLEVGGKLPAVLQATQKGMRVRKAAGERTPLTTTGTTVRPGASRANRSKLANRRPSASTTPGITAGSGPRCSAGKVRMAPPRLRGRAARKSPIHWEGYSATVKR